MSLTIVQGDLLAQPVDAIVNPANSHLRHGGGLARKLAEAAVTLPDAAIPNESERYAMWYSDHADAPLIPTGGAYLTSAGFLPFKGIIHAVGPVWGGGSYCEEHLLMRAHDSACQLAITSGFESIAIPAISCGIFGYPVEKAASVAVGTVLSYIHALDVVLCLFEAEHFDAYLEAWAER